MLNNKVNIKITNSGVVKITNNGENTTARGSVSIVEGLKR